MTQIKIYILIAALLAASGVLLYIKHLQSENKVLTENNAKLTVAVQTQEETIQTMTDDAELAVVAQVNLFREYNDSRNENKKLQAVLSRHDLKYLSQRKPGLVQKKVNAATAKINDCIAALSRGETCNE